MMDRVAIMMAIALTPASAFAQASEGQSAPATSQAASAHPGGGGAYGPPAPLPESTPKPGASNSTGAATGGGQASSRPRHGRHHGYVGVEGGGVLGQ